MIVPVRANAMPARVAALVATASEHLAGKAAVRLNVFQVYPQHATAEQRLAPCGFGYASLSYYMRTFPSSDVYY